MSATSPAPDAVQTPPPLPTQVQPRPCNCAARVLATATLAENGHVKAPELNAYPWTYFPGGFIEWLDPDRGIERRTIEAQGPDGLIRLFGTGDGIEVGQQFTAYPGCAHNTDACKAFGNLLNYGGIPDLAGKSPFDGDPVFI